VTGLAGYVSEPRASSRVPTLDGTDYLETASPSELAAYQWLNREVAGIPVVLEAHGPPYQAFSRVSMNTGLPTVLGWEYHMFQQGRSQPEINARAADVRELYETTDTERTEHLLRKYHVDFIFVGPLERRTYASAGFANAAQPLLSRRLPPSFVAMTRSFGYGWSASAMRRFATNGP